MAWYANPKPLWVVIGMLLVVVVTVTVVDLDDTPAPESLPPARKVEVASKACLRAVRAGEQLAKAAGTALYVAPDFPPLVRNALAARSEEERDSVLEHLKAAAPALRRARSFSERGEPPAWKRFQRWSPRC